MTDKINLFVNQPAKTDAASEGRRVSGQSRTDTAQTSSQGPASDSVRLTFSAKSLSDLEQVINSKPVVDQNRVDALRSAIQSGEYQIDPQRVADKLLRLEQDLWKIS
ncbi:MAG: flagellar biosynthesis anti-sigma factor FlgM [Gammaproteobacteria bacterium]|nr:flagellar biosynthesis anti-sigma factor FlgM [Gammaproteobacteria bacterium]